MIPFNRRSAFVRHSQWLALTLEALVLRLAVILLRLALGETNVTALRNLLASANLGPPAPAGRIPRRSEAADQRCHRHPGLPPEQRAS